MEEDNIIHWEVEGHELSEQKACKRSIYSPASNPAALGIEGHARQIGDMVDAIQNDRPPLVDQYEGRKPIEIIMAVYESAKSRKPVKIHMKCRDML